MTSYDQATKEHIDKLLSEFCTGKRSDGATVSDTDRVAHLAKLGQQGLLPSLVPMLPLLLTLKNSPFTLENHFPFEDMFRFVLPDVSDYMTGRQVGKTQSQAAEGILKTSSISNITTLYVNPLYEQTSRFSTMYVAPLVENSPIKKLLIGSRSRQNVLHRQFLNNSHMIFSYAGLSAERVRGIPADLLNMDEVDNIMPDHMPVIESTLRASKWRIIRRTGTPTTQDRNLAQCWEASSQAEWFIPCMRCTTGGYPTWNIPSSQHHLEAMLGPMRDDISEKSPAVICYKCGKPIFPRLGRWRHRHPDKRWTHAGYHIPQIIMPMHYADPTAWRELLIFRNTWAPFRFYNEILGEPYDLSAKLVTQTQLKAAGKLGPNDPHKAKAARKKYRGVVLAIDWGGGGGTETSFTTLCLLGLTRDHKLECVWGKRLLTPNDHLAEAQEVAWWWNFFKPDIMAHDNCGAGALRETVLRQMGLTENYLMPIEYKGPSRGDIIYPVEPTDHYSRWRYFADKTRAIQLVCAMIQLEGVSFFKWDKISEEQPGLLNDFLALTELKTPTYTSGDLYRIGKMPGRTDDFAHSVVYGALALWLKYNAWPDMSSLRLYKASPAQLQAVDGDGTWMPPEMR